jgi:peptide/nickel transport system substrate-binding protein
MRVAALAATVAAVVAGCGGGGNAHTTTTITAIPGHTFIDLVPVVPDDIDQTGTPSAASASLLPSWSGELVRPASARPGPNAVLPPDDAVVPYLARSWVSEPGGDYVFTLRRGVRAPSGDVLTAADVAWSLERAVARDAEAPFLYTLARIDQADPVTVLGRHRVRINVTGPSPFTLSVLASIDATIYDSRVYRAHASATDPWALQWGSAHEAGFAAYSVSHFVPQVEVVLTADPGFWRHPYYQHVIIRAVASSGQRVAEVLAGAATHTSDLDWDDFTTAISLGPQEGAQAQILQNGPGVIAWQLNVRHGPLANPQVRQAINLGINRAAIANALANTDDVAAPLAIPPIFGRSQPSDFDPVQARTLMRAAGLLPDGITVDVDTNQAVAGGDVSTLLNLLYNQLVQIGVNIHTIYVDNTDQLLAMEQRGAVESSIAVDAPLLGGAGFLLEQNDNAALDPVSPAAEEGYHSAAVQSALDSLRSSPPGAAAQALIQQAETTIDTDLPTIDLVTVPVQNVTRDGVTGYRAYTEPVTYYEYLRAG